MSPRRPVLRYHGGKWRLAPWIIGHFPAHRVYVEPFGGGASVLLRKPRVYAEVYNDLYEDVVGLFRVLRDPEAAMKLLELLELTPFSRTEFLEASNPSPDPVENARRFIIRSHMGFGASRTPQDQTGFRANSNRSGTTPAHDWVKYPAAIKGVTDRLQGVVIESRPASECMEAHDSTTTLHYVDPPYVHSTRSKGNPYCTKHKYAFEMSDQDHRDLAEVLRNLKGFRTQSDRNRNHGIELRNRRQACRPTAVLTLRFGGGINAHA